MRINFSPECKTFEDHITIEELEQVAPSEMIVKTEYGSTKITREGLVILNDKTIGKIYNRNEVESLFLNWHNLPVRY